QGDPAFYPRPARPVLPHHAIRARALKVGQTQDQNRRVVSEGDPDLQRRYRSGAPRNMGASDFFHVAAAPRPRRNSATYLAAYAERARIRCLDRPKSSLEFVQFKNRGNKHRRHISLLILPELQNAIDGTKIGEETFLVNRHRQPYSR